ncbi:6947_t:CDS:10 [Dentiscutata erythropus]|uniref:6947_t:CDS:1 n=1 Tax=Dentiscutata erythropus TaxID=1348616 RepID=A0A9N9DCS7_9GLOM|nr:6947_t:CDS:10 [Dentiscutata erythropus]
MNPETFVNLLFHYIEANFVLSQDYSYVHVLINGSSESDNMISQFRSGSFESYTDVLFAYICSDKIAPNSDFTLNGIFITRLLVQRLRESINPKSYTPLLKLFNNFEPQPNFCKITCAFHISRVPGRTMHWLLSFIRDEATWLLQSEDSNILNTQATQSENISSFLTEQFGKIKSTLMYEDLEFSRLVEGFSKVTNTPIGLGFTDYEILAEQKLQKCQNILEYTTCHPSEHRLLQSKIRMLMYNDIINMYLDRLKVAELEIKYGLKNNQDIGIDHEARIDIFDVSVTELKQLFDQFVSLENKEIFIILIEIAELVTNVPFKFITRILLGMLLLYQFCVNTVQTVEPTKTINFKDINRLFLDIWIIAFSRLCIIRPFTSQQTLASDIRDNLLTLTTLFLYSFNVSMLYIWLPPFNNLKDDTSKPPTVVFTSFLDSLLKIFHKMMSDDVENTDNENMITMIFEKLGFYVPLEVLIRESKDLEKITSKYTWMALLTERLNNINDQE